MRKVSEKIFTTLIIILLIQLLISSNVLAVPHSIFGYTEYKDGNYPLDADVIVYNQDLGEYFNNSKVINNGSYFFDVGSETLNWKDGNQLVITIIQNDDEDYLEWSGTGYITIDLDLSYQEVSLIELSPPDGYVIDNKDGTDKGGLNPFFYLLIIIVILIIILISFLYYKRR
jgi:hypothetical protein